MKSWLQDNDIEMFATYKEGKSGVAKKFIRISKSKIYKCMTSLSKNVYIDKLNDKGNEYNNIWHNQYKVC